MPGTATRTITYDNLNCAQIAEFEATVRNILETKSTYVFLMKYLLPRAIKFVGGDRKESSFLNKRYSSYNRTNDYAAVPLFTDEALYEHAAWTKFMYEVQMAVAEMDLKLNMGPGKVFDNVQQKYEAAMDGMMYDVSSAMWTGDGTSRTILGLAEAVSISANTYAGIDGSVITQWDNQRTDGSTHGLDGLTLDDLDSDEDKVWAQGGQTTVIVTTPAIVRRIRRIATASMTMAQGSGSLGITTGLSHNGIPIEKDATVPAGRIYYFNLDDGGVQLELEQGEALEFTPWYSDEPRSHCQKKFYRFTGRLTCKHRRRQCVRYGVT